jgi:gliding motility-associated-like protein
MLTFLRTIFFGFSLFVVSCILFPAQVLAQGCDGADGTGIFNGSIANRDNGTVCANTPIQPALMEIDISNIDEGGTVQFEINWDDGSALQVVNGVKIAANRFLANVTHTFPPTGAQVKCEYIPDVRLRWNGATCAATLGTPPRFVRWNTDDENTGVLNLVETITGVNTYFVCAGVETNVTFTDRSTLNCVPPDLILGPNNRSRWRQFIYGTSLSVNGTVEVGGVPRAFPFNGAVDGPSAEPTLTSGFPTATTQIITVPVTAQIGDFFEITMNYWNTCNPFPTQTPVTEIARIEVVGQPPAPTGTDQTVCNGTTPGAFVAGGVPGGATVNWYRNVIGSPDTPGTLISSGGSTSLNINAVPGYVNNTTAGIHKVWVSYTPNIANALNCESQKIPITRTIREAITAPVPTTPPPTEICNNTAFTITMSAPATTTIGGATQYTFNGTADVPVTGSTATTGTYTPNVTFAPGELFVDRTISVTRRYTTAPTCDANRNFTVRIWNTPLGGTLDDFPDVCEGTSVGPITLSGHRGTIEQWEVSINFGAFNNYGGPASGNTITPGVLPSGGAGTTYAFRARVGNGTCTDVFSTTEIVFVSPSPPGFNPGAGPDQLLCNLLSTNLAGDDPTVVPGFSGTWTYVGSVPAGKPSPTFMPGNRTSAISITAGNEGAYTMRWTVTNGVCTFVDDVVIDFGLSPNIAPMADVNVCGETATMAAVALTAGTGLWTCVGGTCANITIVDPTSPTTAVNLNGPGFAYGTYSLRWTVTSGNCPTDSDDIDVIFNQAPTATAIDINGVCLASTGTAIPLGGTFGGGAVTGSWVNVDGTGVISVSTVAGNAVTATYTSSLTDHSNGTPIRVKLVAEPSATSSCADAEQEIVINVDRTPVPIATTPRSTCENFIQLDAESPIPFAATGVWTGPGGIIFDDPTDPQTFARNIPAAPSTVTLRWTLTSAGGNNCTDFIDVQVNRVVAPNATNLNLLLCESPPAGAPLTTSVRLADYENSVTTIPAADRTIQWYQDGPPPLGVPVADPTVTFLNVPDGKVYVARIQQISTTCSSDAIVTINVRPLPTAVDATVAICEDTPGSNTASNIDLLNDITYKDAVTDVSNTVVWYNSMVDAVNALPGTEITGTFNITGPGQFVYARISYSSGAACPDIAELNLAVNPLPTNNVILGRSQVCLGDPSTPPDELPVETYQVAAITGAKYYWNIPTGPTKFKVFGGGTEDDFFVLLQFPNIPVPNPENISVRVELNGCSSPVIQLPITVSPQPIAPIVVGDDVVCENDEGISYEVNPTNFPASNYNWEIRKQSDDLEGGAFVSLGQGTDQILVNFLDEPIYITVREVNSICVSDTTQYWVKVNPRPIILDSDVNVCSDSPTGVIFMEDGGSPVLIDKYDISSVITTAGINFVTPPGGPPFPVTGVAANAIQGHAFENITAVPLSVNYTVTPISVDAITTKECAGTPQVITVTVDPEPQLSPGLSRSICSEEETGIVLISAANTFPADRFIIANIIVPPGVTPLVPGNIPVADGTTLYLDNVLFNNAWVNTTGDNQVVMYDVLPYSTLLGCTGNPPTTINVTIFPRTDVDPVVVAPICNGDLLNVSFSSPNNADADFLWMVKSYDPWVTINATAAGLGNIVGMSITNTSLTVDGTVTFEVTGKNQPTEEGPGGCVNPIQTFVVTILKSPIANAQDLSACSDAPGGNTYTADLAVLEPIITPDAGDPNTQIIWYETDPRLGPAAVIPPASLTAFVMTDGVPVFVEVEYLPTTCKVVVPVQYTVNPGISITSTLSDFNGFNLRCNADNSGEIRIDVATGTPAYSYRIDGGPFINAGVITYTFSSLAAGPHTVEVQDTRGCAVSEAIDLIEPSPLSATLAIDQEISCFLGSDGIISTLAAGGTGTYASYLLLQTNTTDPNGDGIFDNLGAGTYNVRVTDSNNCRVDSNPIDLVQPTQVEINSLTVATDANGFNLSCRDANDGEIEITFSGGNVPPDYTITLTKASDPGNPYIDNTTANATTFTGLGFGNYTAIVEDAKGCPSLPASAIIVNPPPFSPGFVGINQSLCVGDDPTEIQQLVPAFGGVGNYQYQWQQSLTGSMNDAEWIDIPGATTVTYDPGVLAQTTYFRRLAESVSARTGLACEVLGKNNIVQVTINPLPVASFNAPSEVCQGESFTLQLGISAGTAPIEYDYSAGATTFLNLIGTENTAIPISNFQDPTTYTLLRVKDLNGCLAQNVPQSVSVDVIKINPDFTVLAPAEQCSGGTFTFQWVAELGVKYTWIWSDGQQDVINPGDIPLGVNTITHVFTSGSTESETIYPVRLQAENALCTPKTATHPIKVFPTIVLNIIPGDPILCSGEDIRFVDQSQGVDVGKWYYQVVGTTNQQDIRSGPVPDITYTMINNTTANPIMYEVVYEASNNEGCTDEFRKEVKVYRGIAAGILSDPDPPTPFNGGVSTVTFTNNSVPLDDTAFEYTWDFGDVRADPPNGTGVAPFTVDYFSAGIKNITLKAVNIEARDTDNKTCQSVATKNINIELPMLGADFRVTPHASCFPVDLVVENLSPGADTFLWEVYDQGGLVTTSTLRNPVFRIHSPGIYDIYLTASFYATGQTALADVKGIEVLDVPTALFEMRPNPLYVPDTELQTFNQSLRANTYFWDFDDGSTSTQVNPTHLYKLEGKYNITLVAGFDYGLKDVDGDPNTPDVNITCYDTVRHELNAQDGGFIKLPNAFTPGLSGSTGGVPGSGTFNDVFLPIARGVEEFEMDIFDRWGNLIFQSKDRNIGWDGYDRHGRLMPAGVYVYKLVLRLSDGQRTTKVGDVTLIR